MKKLPWFILSALLMSTAFLIGDPGEAKAVTDDSLNASSVEYDNTLEQYQAEGIVIGTEGTYAPFTFVDENGELTGFDVELITEVFTRMGIEVTFETSEWDGLIAGMDAGRWDVVANQISITPEREEKYSFSDPYLTSSPVIITTSDNSDIDDMSDLEGKKVAAATGSEYYTMAEEAGAEVVVCDSFAQAVELVMNGQVDATINDSLTYYDFMNQQPDTEVKIAYTSPEVTEVAFMFPEGNEELIAEFNATLAEVKADGTYDEIYNEYFGVPVETEEVAEPIPTSLEIFIDSFIPLLTAGLKFTIPIAVVSFILGTVLALLVALARLSDIKPLRWIAQFYVWIFRGTPLLVQLFILFYGLPALGINMDAVPAAILGFTLNVGAYSSEIFRASILSIPKGQWEAAKSIGMTKTQAMKRIILPQSIRVSIPTLGNSFISLVKDTSLAAVITVPEMFQKAQQIAAVYYEPLLLYVEVAMIYLMFCTVLSFLQAQLEKKYNQY